MSAFERKTKKKKRPMDSHLEIKVNTEAADTIQQNLR